MGKIFIFVLYWNSIGNFNMHLSFAYFGRLGSTYSPVATLPCLTVSLPQIPSFCLPMRWMSVLLLCWVFALWINSYLTNPARLSMSDFLMYKFFLKVLFVKFSCHKFLGGQSNCYHIFPFIVQNNLRLKSQDF
mgnify:CR=1 FL=1